MKMKMLDESSASWEGLIFLLLLLEMYARASGSKWVLIVSLTSSSMSSFPVNHINKSLLKSEHVSCCLVLKLNQHRML